MDIRGARFAIVGALDALTRRRARRQIELRGGILRHGMSRRVDHAVFGHRMARSWPSDRVEARIAEVEATGAGLLSENAFMQVLGLAQPPESARGFSAADLMRQSGLAPEQVRNLVLFDAFDFTDEPFGMRDVIAARQYAKLLAEGVRWPALIRAVRSRGRMPDGSLAVSNARLERSGRDHVVMRVGDTLTELDGQHMLPLCGREDEDAELDTLMDEADAAQLDGDWDKAILTYRRCLALDPENPLIPFSLGYALIQRESWRDASIQLHRTLKLDPGYAEAWYNLGSIALRRGDSESAGRYLRQAIAADPDYPDPIFNLALLEYEAGAHAEAAKLWTRYLELDPDTAWADRARHGLRLIQMAAHRERVSAGSQPAATAGTRP